MHKCSLLWFKSVKNVKIVSYSQESNVLRLKFIHSLEGFKYFYYDAKIQEVREIQEEGVIEIGDFLPGEWYNVSSFGVEDEEAEYGFVEFDCELKGNDILAVEGHKIKIPDLPVTFTTYSTVTSATASFTLGECGLDVISKKVFIDNQNTNEGLLTVSGLEPDRAYQAGYEITLKNATGKRKVYSGSNLIKTKVLELKVLPPKVVSLGNVIVSAATNIDEEETNVGFEWRRKDWTSEFPSQTGTGHIYEGMMEGYIRNMNTEKLFNVRPYYLSNSGKYYYGDWMGLDPSNTSYFEPTVHTYAKISVDGNTALVQGYALGGTDKIKVQGFKYWKSSSSISYARAAKIPVDVMTVEANGQVMTATLDELDYASDYHYVAFVTTVEGETFYGDERTFSTDDDPTGIIFSRETTSEPVTVIARYSIDGRKLDVPQKGLNIILMSDGTSKKVMIR